MHYIKLGLWIFILSVLYAGGIFRFLGFYPEFLLLFSLIYSLWSKTFGERITVAVISGVFMGALSGYGFLFCVLLVLYSTLIFFRLFSGRLKRYKSLMILAVFIITVLYQGILGVFYEGLFYIPISGAVINCVFTLILQPLIKRSFEEKERYIF